MDMKIDVKGKKTDYVNVEVDSEDMIIGMIKSLGCTNYDVRYYDYTIIDNKLIEQYDSSYDGRGTYNEEDNKVISEDEEVVKVFRALTSVLNYIYKKKRE